MSDVQAFDLLCAMCRGEKRVEITRDVEDSGGVLVIGGEVTIEEPLRYVPEPNDRIRVFCSRCGLVYHEDSIA